MMDKILEASADYIVLIVVGLITYAGAKYQSKQAAKAVESSEKAATSSQKAATLVQTTQESIMETNGGSSVKDSLNRIEDGNRWLDTRLDRVVDIQERSNLEVRQLATRLDDHIKEHKHD